MTAIVIDLALTALIAPYCRCSWRREAEIQDFGWVRVFP
jgi:hypothetical protein